MRFTVRRPPIGEVSPCGHRPSGGDVTCSVDVGVAPSSGAGLALENRLALAVPGSDVPTHRASLRRIRGGDLLNPTVSFVLQARGEQPPTAAADGAVQPAFLSDSHTGLLHRSARGTGHRPHVKGFYPIVSKRRAISEEASRPNLCADRPHGPSASLSPFRSGAPVGAARGPAEPLLQHRQPLGRTWGRLGACSSSPVDSAAATTTPRSMPTTLRSPGPATGSGMWANATCQRPARSRITR